MEGVEAAGGGWVSVGGAVGFVRWPHGLRHTSGHLTEAAVKWGFSGVPDVMCWWY